MKGISRRSIVGGLAVAVSALAPMVAHAEPPAVRAEEVVVTATRLTPGPAGASTSVITADEIARTPAATLPEILALTPGAQARDLYGGTGAARASVDLRGFGATAKENALVLLDGRRLNDIDLAQIDYANIPRESIERIEVLRGNAGGVLYGEGAVGGAINIVTKEAAREAPATRAALALGSHARREATASTVQAAGPWSASAYVSDQEGAGYRRHNDLLQRNLIVDVRRTGEAAEAYLKLGRDEQRLSLPGARLVTVTSSEMISDRRGATTPFDYANQDGLALSGGLAARLAPGARVVLDAGMRRKEQAASLISPFGGAFDEYVATGLTTWSLTPRLMLDTAVAGRSLSAVLGLDFGYADYESDRKNTLSAPPVHRYAGMQRTEALYAQGTLALAPATDLTLGARVMRMRVRAGDIFDPSAPTAFGSGHEALHAGETHTAALLGIEHRLTDALAVFGHLAQNVRLPTIDERIGGRGDTTLDLATQTSKEAEAGARFDAGRLSLQLAAYVMDLENELHFDPVAFVSTNLDQTRRHGAEAEARFRLSEALSLRAALAETRSRFTAGEFDGKNVPLVSPHTASAGLDWAFAEWATLAATVRYAAAKWLDNDEGNVQPRIPGYALADLKVSGAVGRLRWTAAVNNLFDTEYFNYGVASAFTQGRYNAYPLPGRTLWVSAGVVF
ncbi:MAG: TonB-dependent receptor [Proteobacteria bacterium]|nr:TonB-dependent receptor [Pseudomonadota bacterium]